MTETESLAPILHLVARKKWCSASDIIAQTTCAEDLMSVSLCDFQKVVYAHPANRHSYIPFYGYRGKH